jgi:hypothetical protein
VLSATKKEPRDPLVAAFAAAVCLSVGGGELNSESSIEEKSFEEFCQHGPAVHLITFLQRFMLKAAQLNGCDRTNSTLPNEA